MIPIDPNKRIIDVTAMTLDEWLELLKRDPEDAYFIDYKFPTDAHVMSTF